MLVCDVMSSDPITVSPQMSAPELAHLLIDRNITGAPVVDPTGQLVGVVSRSDLLRYAATPHGWRSLGDFYRHLWAESEEVVALSDSVKVADLMSRTVYSVVELAPLREVADLMLEHHIHRVVVTRQGRVVGLATTTDLMSYLARLLPMEAHV